MLEATPLVSAGACGRPGPGGLPLRTELRRRGPRRTQGTQLPRAPPTVWLLRKAGLLLSCPHRQSETSFGQFCVQEGFCRLSFTWGVRATVWHQEPTRTRLPTSTVTIANSSQAKGRRKEDGLARTKAASAVLSTRTATSTRVGTRHADRVPSFLSPSHLLLRPPAPPSAPQTAPQRFSGCSATYLVRAFASLTWAGVSRAREKTGVVMLVCGAVNRLLACAERQGQRSGF